MVPEHPDDDGVEISRRAAKFWATEWSGTSMMAVGALDPVFTVEHMEKVRQVIRGCPAMHVVSEAGHFVQEHGKAIAEEAVRVLGS
jgi:pimeloyl-ACP methyl ester carboxylesterase